MRSLSILGIWLILATPLTVHAADDFSVAVTVKPVHSLVAGIMKGAGEPELIMSTGASPHHYSLRPSERRAMANASLIVWVGPELESFMPRILDSMGTTRTDIALIEAEAVLRLPVRSADHHAHAHSHVDPHIWLSTQNAHAMVDAVADALSRLDPDNAPVYASNRKRLHQRISDTDQQIRHLLSDKTSAFLSYHDAYQYFEHDYGLNNAGFVSNSEDLSPGARHIHEIREMIREQKIHCLLYEAPNRPALVDTVTRDFDVKVQEIDAMGIRYQAGEDAWFEIMTGLAQAAKDCL